MSQGREGIVKRGPGRPPRHSPYARLADSEFKFKTGDLVLVKWTDGMVYFAKIKKIDYKRQKCAVVFDDKSQDEAHFRQIHSVDETTTDIICIKCKKDDSDKPNEIVLCDMCGIGFHQKCHIPNIPASALELSTPWNCSYCQKGVKCPYLTDRLDVLQNLFFDDEGSGTEDNVDATNTFDSDHYEPAVVDEVSIPEQVSPRKKRGRKPAAEATVAMKRERRKAPHQSSSIVTMDFRPQLSSEAWKSKSYAPSNEDGDSEPVYISSGKSTPEPSPRPTQTSAAQVGVKRKRLHHGTSPGSGGGKKQKRSSVESRTVSVTRVSVPVYDSSSSAEEMETSRDSSVCESSFSSSGPQGLGSIREESAVHEKRPRSLRVSLSIPDEVEPGTPFDKVMKVHHHQRASSPQHHRDLSTTETKELPSWENFENSNLLHRASSPKQRPKTLTTEKSDVIFTKSNTTTTVKPAPEPAVSAPSKNTHSAFLASPLPISSSPKLPAVVTTPSSAPAPDVKASVRSSSSGSSSFSSLDVGVKNKTTSSQQQSSPPLPTAVPVGVGYSAPAPAADVVVTTKPSAPVVVASQQPESNPSILPPQRGSHQPNQPQPKPTKPPSGSPTSTTSTPATPPSGPSTILSPATKPITVPTETSAPNRNPSSGGIPPVPAGQQRPQPQQQSVLVSGPRPQPAPTSTTVPPPKSTGHVLVAQQKPLAQQQQQQLPSTAAPQKVPSIPVHLHHQSVAASIAQSTQSPSATGQQMVVTSRPSIQQSVVVSSNSQRAPSIPAMQQQQQQVLNRPPSNVSAVNQSVIQQQQQQPVYVASTRPASVPGQKHQVVVSTARPSSVPIQQNRPPSVPMQQQQQNVVIAPPRPSSVPTQLQQVVRSHSHSQSQSPSVSTPTVAQHVLVTYSQSGAPLKQVVVTQPPAYVTKSTAIFQAAQSTSTPPASTSVLTHASPVPLNVQYSGPMVQTQRQLQEQAIAAAKKTATQSALGDADVIITAVESNTSRANQGQSVGYHSAVTPTGEKIMILNASSGQGAIPYQTTALSAGMGVRKVMAKAVDVSGQMAPSGSVSLPIAAAASGQTQFVSTATVGSQAPASVVPVVLAPASNSLPMSTMASPHVVYQVSTNPQTQPSATQVARGATSLRTVSVNNSNNSLANGTRAVQVLANSQPTTPVIVACVPGSAGQPVGVSTTKPYAIVNAMPGTTQIPAAASLPQPPKTYSLVPEKQTQQHREVVQTISKKIGDAFDSGNEKLLVAAFEDAWKKFQDNGEQYKPPGGHIKSTGTAKVVSKDPPPPNAEVFAVPGTTSRVSLVRQTSANRTVLAPIAPKTSSPIPTQQVIAPPPLSSKEKTQSYVYTAATSADQPAQVYLQQITTGQKQQQQQSLSHSKVHSSGLFYPPSSTESVTVVQKKAPGPGTGIQRIVSVSQSSSGVHHSRSGDRPVRETSESQQTTTTHRRRSNKSKYCARCGKSATYLCSGCHMEWYCGRECQLKAWDAHAEHCKA